MNEIHDDEKPEIEETKTDSNVTCKETNQSASQNCKMDTNSEGERDNELCKAESRTKTKDKHRDRTEEENSLVKRQKTDL